jgi:pyochelin synthetase
VTTETLPPELPTVDVYRPWFPLSGAVGAVAAAGQPSQMPAPAPTLALTLDRKSWTAFSERAARFGGTGSRAVFTAFTDVIAAWSRSAGFAVRRADESGAVAVAVPPDRSASFAARMSAVENLVEVAAGQLPVGFCFGMSPVETDESLIGCHAQKDGYGGLRVAWRVREEAFPTGLIEAMFGAFDELLTALADTDSRWRRSGTVPLPADQARRRVEINATDYPLPDRLLHDDVVERCRRTPDATAVVAADATLSYAELLGRATAVARALREHPGGPGAIVAVALDKSAAQVAGVLGVLLASAAYLPLDMSQPPARRDRILTDAEVRVVLVPDASARDGGWPDGVTALPLDGLDGLAGLDGAASLDTSGSGAAEDVPSSPADPEDLAYVIYTSGSTGVPKGVMISHRAALNTVADLNRRFAVSATDRVLGLASLGFDLSVYDLFGLLAAGGAVVLPDPGRGSDPAHWADLVAQHGVTLWNSVPAQLAMLADHLAGEDRRPVGLRLALLSGDWIPVPLPDRIRALIPGLRVVSLGGATEAAIWSIWHDVGAVPAHWPSIPYGIPLDNQRWHVLDERLRPRPDGAVAELYIGGAGLAIGYLGDPEKTAYRFITHPDTGERLYRTGDFGRYHADGVIELLGREDRQVKIRGHRVELAEVETALLAHPAVKDGAVVALPDPSGGLRLAAYFVGRTDAPESATVAATDDDAEDATQESAQRRAADLREHLSAALPAYMVPTTFTALPALPLTSNGKVDRTALPVPTMPAGSGAASLPDGPDDAPATETERALAEIWAEALEVETVGPPDDFFVLGGHSMLATQMLAEVRERFGIKVPLRLVFEETTLRGFAAAVEARIAAHVAEQGSQNDGAREA